MLHHIPCLMIKKFYYQGMKLLRILNNFIRICAIKKNKNIKAWINFNLAPKLLKPCHA